MKNNFNRITLISTLPPLKGMSPYTVGLVNALSKKIEINFIGFKKLYPEVLYPGGSIDKNSIIPKFNNNVHIDNLLVWWNPITWIKAGLSINTRIVHAQWWSWFLAPVYITVLGIAKLRGKKIIITVHNVKPHEKSLYKVILNNSVLALADEYIVHSENNKQQFLEVNKCKKNVHVIPHGIIEMPKSKLSVANLRKKYKFIPTDKIILFFGNIRKYKGLAVLLNSLNYINDKNIKLIIAGNPWEGFDEYREIIENKSLSNQVRTFLSFNSDKKVSELFKLSDIVVYPYIEFEASSGAASLAIHFEKPIVVTNVGGLTESIQDQNAIATPNNPKNLASKIIYAFSCKNKLIKDSKIIRTKYSWESISNKYYSKLYL